MAASTAAITASIWITRSTSASRRTRVTAGRIAPMAQSALNVGLIGLGTVGSQVAERMLTWRSQLARRAGVELCLRRVLVRDVAKRRSVEIEPDLMTTDPSVLLDDPDIQVVVEVAGGDEPMRGYLERAIRAGKHVVTANKVVMAKHGLELLELAAEKNVDLYFEAAVGGGIPLISTFRTDLQANRIERLSAVINGTTNYVLGRMGAAGLSLDEAVREAQAAGASNAVFVEGDLVGQVLLVGQGAGGRPTASAVVGDLIDLARSIRRGVQSRPSFSFDDRVAVIPMGEVMTRAYYRIRVDDRAGVLAAIGQVYAEEGVSISSFIQKDAWVQERTAELVVTTHPSSDASLQQARARIAKLEPVHAVSSFLRVF